MVNTMHWKRQKDKMLHFDTEYQLLQVFLKDCCTHPQSTHRVATANVWLTFDHNGKIAQAGEGGGGGYTPPPFYYM
jgi:hypothetical protein